MTVTEERMALWLAYSLREFSDDELQTLIFALQHKLFELREIFGYA